MAALRSLGLHTLQIRVTIDAITCEISWDAAATPTTFVASLNAAVVARREENDKLRRAFATQAVEEFKSECLAQAAAGLAAARRVSIFEAAPFRFACCDDGVTNGRAELHRLVSGAVAELGLANARVHAIIQDWPPDWQPAPQGEPPTPAPCMGTLAAGSST